MAMIMDLNVVTCYHVSRIILSGTVSNDTDLNFLVKTLTDLYLEERSTIESAITHFLLYSNKCGIGKVTFTFNNHLENVIELKDKSKLITLIRQSVNMFPELENNQYLTNDDMIKLRKQISSELHTLALMFKTVKNKLQLSEPIDKITFGQCDDITCMIDNNKSLSKYYLTKHNTTPTTIQTVDDESVYCFNTLILIKLMTDEVPINPATYEPFNKRALDFIKRRLRKEIALYNKFIDLK